VRLLTETAPTTTERRPDHRDGTATAVICRRQYPI